MVLHTVFQYFDAFLSVIDSPQKLGVRKFALVIGRVNSQRLFEIFLRPIVFPDSLQKHCVNEVNLSIIFLH